MDEKEITKIYKALSANSRIQILKLIKDKKLCVNAITKKLSISQSAVSQHLDVLKKAGLVKSDRYVSIIHYTINKTCLDNFKISVKKYLGKEFILIGK